MQQVCKSDKLVHQQSLKICNYSRRCGSYILNTEPVILNHCVNRNVRKVNLKIMQKFTITGKQIFVAER